MAPSSQVQIEMRSCTMASSSLNIFAIIVGIDKYKNQELPRLHTAVADAIKLAQLLTKDLEVPKENVKTLYNEEATKVAITNAISSLPELNGSTLHPGNAILFFFSGLAGKAGERVGMICPFDINTESQTGISDATLTRLFNQIARSYGNNITLLLDCDAEIFNWDDPSGFVVITPEDATETEVGGTLTESVVDVLKSEKEYDMLHFLTVQSFVYKIKANSNKRPIKCFGRNIDRPLFHRAHEGAFHSFILGQTEVGEIKINAGLAHGIIPNTKLAIFRSNVKDPQNAKLETLVGLVVDSAEATTATLRCSSARDALSLPSIFYVTETCYPAEEVDKIVKVLVKGHSKEIQDSGLSRIWGKQKVNQMDDANITVNFDEEPAVLYWNGAKDDKNSIRGNYQIHVSHDHTDINEDSKQQLIRTLKKTTRFAYHLLRTSPTDSLLAQSLHVQLLKAEGSNAGAGNPENTLLDNFCVELEHSEKDKVLGPFYLEILNKSKYDIWVYVFTFDPQSLSIIPWYPLSPSVTQSPLEAGKSLTVGRGDEEGLLFEWDNIEEVGLLYLKVFATREKTDFSFLMQQFKSSAEDRVRELRILPSVDPSPHPAQSMDDLETFGSKVKFGSLASWAAVRIAVARRLKN